MFQTSPSFSRNDSSDESIDPLPPFLFSNNIVSEQPTAYIPSKYFFYHFITLFFIIKFVFNCGMKFQF